MIAFDTNLLVRLATNDDEVQASIAEQLLNENQVYISRTVLLETEWVLRSVYKFARSDIADFFEQAQNTKNLFFENEKDINQAVIWYKLGADFADAMHLSACADTVLHTFDEKFCKSAKQLGLTPEFRVLKDKK